jgi:uncharacterized phage-associated protein
LKGFNYKKSVQSLVYFAQNSGGVLSKMKAIKLIWLSDRLHLRKYGRTITGDSYFALKFGPVAGNTRDLLENSCFISEEENSYCSTFLKQEGRHYYAAIAEPVLNIFSESEREVIDIIFKTYSKYDQFQLSTYSHLFPEWKKYESQLNKGICSRFAMDIADFFKDPQDNHAVFIEDPAFLEMVNDYRLKKHYSNEAVACSSE